MNTNKKLLSVAAVAAVAMAFLPNANAQIDLGGGRLGGQLGRVQDRVQRQVDRTVNRAGNAINRAQNAMNMTPRGSYFNDSTWGDFEPMFDQYNISPIQARTQTQANARANARFGFNDPNAANANGNWYYDYYDYPATFYYPANGTQQAYSYQYYDADGDGIYDRGYTVYDRDGDGVYETSDEYRFDNRTSVAQQSQTGTDNSRGDQAYASGQSELNAQANSDLEFRPSAGVETNVSGTVNAVKMAKRHGNQHMLIQVKANQAATANASDQMMVVDAGPADRLREVKVMQGDEISVTGRQVNIGDKPLVVASKMTVNGETIDVQPFNQNRMSGTVLETRTVTVQDQPHRVVVLKSDNGNQLVDLGPQDQLNVDLAADQQITVSGVPVRMRNRQVYMAHQLQTGGQDYSIGRLQIQTPQK